MTLLQNHFEFIANFPPNHTAIMSLLEVTLQTIFAAQIYRPRLHLFTVIPFSAWQTASSCLLPKFHHTQHNSRGSLSRPPHHNIPGYLSCIITSGYPKPTTLLLAGGATRSSWVTRRRRDRWTQQQQQPFSARRFAF